jgi:hypothetical protein
LQRELEPVNGRIAQETKTSSNPNTSRHNDHDARQDTCNGDVPSKARIDIAERSDAHGCESRRRGIIKDAPRNDANKEPTGENKHVIGRYYVLRWQITHPTKATPDIMGHCLWCAWKKILIATEYGKKSRIFQCSCSSSPHCDTSSVDPFLGPHITILDPKEMPKPTMRAWKRAVNMRAVPDIMFAVVNSMTEIVSVRPCVDSR